VGRQRVLLEVHGVGRQWLGPLPLDVGDLDRQHRRVDAPAPIEEAVDEPADRRVVRSVAPAEGEQALARHLVGLEGGNLHSLGPRPDGTKVCP
jgi:hypothetical protein